MAFIRPLLDIGRTARENRESPLILIGLAVGTTLAAILSLPQNCIWLGLSQPDSFLCPSGVLGGPSVVAFKWEQLPVGSLAGGFIGYLAAKLLSRAD